VGSSIVVVVVLRRANGESTADSVLETRCYCNAVHRALVSHKCALVSGVTCNDVSTFVCTMLQKYLTTSVSRSCGWAGKDGLGNVGRNDMDKEVQTVSVSLVYKYV
jgi:hypothetical protein